MTAIATARIETSYAGIGELLKSAEVRADLTSRAGAVLGAVQAAESDYTYRITQHTTDRAVVRVGSDDPGALFEEAETGQLARALDAAR
jgi:hypothetical protein